MENVDPRSLAKALNGLWEWAQSQGVDDAGESFKQRLRDHVGGSDRPIVSRALPGYQRVNFQLAIDEFLSLDGRSAELVGMPMMHGYRAGLAEVLRTGGHTPWMDGEEPGAVEYEQVTVGDQEISCVAAGLWLIQDRETPMLLMLRREDRGPSRAELALEVMAKSRREAEGVLDQLKQLMSDRNVYRGRVLVLSASHFGGVGVEVQELPPVTRSQVVLPEQILERIERHTKTFAEHRDALRAAGQHLKRGLLLHGPPGTGKTLSVMYLSTLMPDRTVLLLTGQGLGLVEQACEMARELAPTMLVIEDVDLIAQDRMHGHPTTLLFDLLNQMDGLGTDIDIVFVLTTNMPEVLEPALASRPGRIDLAVEMPLPDADGRIRLLELFGRNLELQLTDRERFVEATEGSTPAFMREVVRRATLTAAQRGNPPIITDDILLGALGELRDGTDQLMSRILGATSQNPVDSDQTMDASA